MSGHGLNLHPGRPRLLPARGLAGSVAEPDVAVVGAGVVGLAIARALAEGGRSVTVLERHERPALEQSTHNSQVLHSGIFARPGTLRARLNVEGIRLAYARARDWGVPVDRSGTLVVAATPAERPQLDRVLATARANGVDGVVALSPDAAREREPHLGPCEGAVWSPNGGRIDVGSFVAALEREARRLGAEVRTGFDLASARRDGDLWRLTAGSGATARAGWVVNSAGVASGEVARVLGAPGYRIYPCLGEYARVVSVKREWVRSMIYGFAPAGYPGIGVHLTRTLSGELLLGPTARYLDGPTVPDPRPTSMEEFAREAARFLPGLDTADLAPAPAGVRAKSVPPGAGEAFGDFTVAFDPPGERVVQLVGIESPGLTASLALAEHVAREIGPREP